MKHGAFPGEQSAVRIGILIAAAINLIFCVALPARADRASDARDQFERAIRMRTTLEGYLEKDRSLSDYKQTVAAYQKVYLFSVTADEVTPSLIAEAELYQEMGRLYDPKYFDVAIKTYNFLIEQYPGSRYRGAAMLAIARIQKDEIKKPDDAETTYKAYLKLFPKSENAGAARDGLKQIAAARAQAARASAAAVPASASIPNQPPAENGQRVGPRVSDDDPALVKGVRTWNSADSTRIVVALDNTIKYDAARIASPDRIYFDMYKARLAPDLAKKPLPVSNGLLKSVRVGPNRIGVVRLVLDVDGAHDYSAYLLSNPYRLVIDVHASGTAMANNAQAERGPANAASDPAKSSDPAEPARTAPVREVISVNSTPTPSMNTGTTSAAMASLPTAPKSSSLSTKSSNPKLAITPPPEPKPTRDGDRSLTRTLGLKISRIVIDAGHGGYDTGTVGPHGLMEKDLCLDVALRLGALIQQRLPGAEVIYTRRDDTFIPLEERTKIANEAKADLFISIHANSSPDASARGVETYYLNFATSPESMEVAARENANSQESLHDLQDLIQKIARNEKIEESKELAGDIQGNLTQRLQLVSQNERNRGVKKAPFVVLIGANMPSVLAEISFVSNPYDERLLRKPPQRQRIADGLYRGIATYLGNINSLTYNKQKLVSDNHSTNMRLDVGSVASASNPK